MPALLCTLLLSSCTAIHWQNADGELRHLGLVAAHDVPLAVGRRVTVYSLGASLSLVPGRFGYALGLSWNTDEFPDVRVIESGAELQEAVAPWIGGEPPEGDPEPAGWRLLGFSSPRDLVARRTVGTIGVGFDSTPEARGLVLGYATSTWLTSETFGWNSVFVRRVESARSRSFSILWTQGASEPDDPPPTEKP